MNANPQSAIPLYFQIEQDLASLIARGTLAPGSPPREPKERVGGQRGVRSGREVMKSGRVRRADDVAMSREETYLPMDLGRKVVENDLEVYPIFSLLEGKYDTPLLEADYRLEAASADTSVAEALEVEERSPILLIERVSYTLNQRPVDYEKLY